MLLRDKQIKEITDRLSWVEATVKNNGSLNLLDINIHSEYFFCGLLNIVLGLKLENLNKIQKDYTAIDLGDSENGIAIQVTSRRDREKVQSTLDSFISHHYNDIYHRLIILVIGEKTNFRKDFSVGENFKFDTSQDIWDMKQLIFEIGGSDATKLTVISDFLNEQLYPNMGYSGRNYEKLLADFNNRAYAVCKTKLCAMGISDEIADRIIKADIDSNKYQYALDGMIEGKQYLIGEFGTGKSHILAVLTQRLFSLYKSGKEANIPIYAQAKDIARVGSIQQWLSEYNINQVDCYIFVDGLDEIDNTIARQLVDEVSILSIQKPTSKILVASRPMGIIAEHLQIRVLPLSDSEKVELYDTISGSGGSNAFRWMRDPLKTSLSKPFFCIAFSLFKSEPQGWAKSEIDLVSELVNKSLQKSGLQSESIISDLSEIAVIAVEHNMGDVHLSDVHIRNSIDDILKTGFVLKSEQYLSFPLPIIAQWFGAKGIREGKVDIADIVSDRAKVFRWRYALSILFSQMTYEESLDYFAKVVRSIPGVAAEIIRNGKVFGKANSLPTAVECGKRIQETMQIWIEALGPLSEYIAPVGSNGIKPLAICSKGTGIIYSWLNDESDELVQNISYDEMRLKRVAIHSCGISAQSTWPWIITFDYLSSRLESVVESHSIIFESEQMQREYLWDTLLHLTSKGSLYEKGIDLTTFERYRQYIGKSLNVNGRRIYADFLFTLIDKYLESGITEIFPPFPVSDKSPRNGGWIWSGYSSEGLLEKTRFVYQTALMEYLNIVNKVFAAFQKDLRMSMIAPFVIIGGLDYQEDGDSYESAPDLTWYIKALPKGNASYIDIQLRHIDFDSLDIRAIHQQNISLRPELESIFSTHITSQILRIFGSTPVTEVVFSWLEEELKEISWIK